MKVGDSTCVADVEDLFGGDLFDVLVTSPPYGDQRTYGQKEEVQWLRLMRDVYAALPAKNDAQLLTNLGTYMIDGEVQLYFLPWIAWMREIGWKNAAFYIWDKLEPMPGVSTGLLQSCHEYIVHQRRRKRHAAKIFPNEGSGDLRAFSNYRDKNGSRSDNAPTVTGSHKIGDSIFRAMPDYTQQTADKPWAHHPAKMPVALARQMLQAFPCDLAYEPFSGSGTTLIAATQTKTKCYAMELNRTYAEAALRRVVVQAGFDPVRQDGKHFTEFI